MGRRPDPAASRRAILEAAHDCFSRSGYAGTSMHDIAQAAGVTQSLIHHHFGPKDALWAEVREQTFAAYVAQQRALVRGLAQADRVRPALSSYFRFFAAHPDVVRLVAWLELDRPAAMVDQLRAVHAEGLAAVSAGQRAGHLRGDLPAHAIVTALLGLVRTWFQERNLVEDESDAARVAAVDEAYLEALWVVLTGGLIPGSATSEPAPGPALG